MWPRKQLDIDWTDLAFGLRCVFSRRPRPADATVVPESWISPEESLVTLSVRTGWDLLLSALRFPPGSEIIVSAVTIPDMVRIIEHHDLVAVPVDVDAHRLEPVLDVLDRSITPQTRAILVAHLLGARVDMAPIIRLARQHGLMVIEDCAQAFVGQAYAGHPLSDCSLFSFGPIKTATALGGAIVRVRDPALRSEMVERHRAYRVQSRRAYLRRLGKYALLRLLSVSILYGALVRAYGLLGIDYDEALGNATHSFGTTDFFEQIRSRPSSALLRMLQRRLATFAVRGAPRLDRRTARGEELAAALPAGAIVGGQNFSHTYWVMPILVANPDEVLPALRTAGFDATGRSSLIVVSDRDRLSDDQPPCASWLADTIFLPNGHHMPDSEWKRMSLIVAEVTRLPAPCQPPQAALPCPVSVSS